MNLQTPAMSANSSTRFRPNNNFEALRGNTSGHLPQSEKAVRLQKSAGNVMSEGDRARGGGQGNPTQ